MNMISIYVNYKVTFNVLFKYKIRYMILNSTSENYNTKYYQLLNNNYVYNQM